VEIPIEMTTADLFAQPEIPGFVLVQEPLSSYPKDPQAPSYPGEGSWEKKRSRKFGESKGGRKKEAREWL